MVMTFLIWVHQCDCELQSRVREVDTENLVEASIFANLGEASRISMTSRRGGNLGEGSPTLDFHTRFGHVISGHQWTLGSDLGEGRRSPICGLCGIRVGSVNFLATGE